QTLASYRSIQNALAPLPTFTTSSTPVLQSTIAPALTSRRYPTGQSGEPYRSEYFAYGTALIGWFAAITFPPTETSNTTSPPPKITEARTRPDGSLFMDGSPSRAATISPDGGRFSTSDRSLHHGRRPATDRLDVENRPHLLAPENRPLYSWAKAAARCRYLSV